MRKHIVLCLVWVAVLGTISSGYAQLQTRDETFAREYKIGPKDLLEITIFELPELNQTVRVSEEGSISLPLLGSVVIEGLTKEEVQNRIASLLLEKNYVKNARVTVFIKEYQSKRVAMLGALTKPGMYELIGRMTLLQMISQAGGLTERAANEIFVLREDSKGNQERIAIDVEDLINNGNPKLNIVLSPNDIINIPIDQIISIFVFGEVRNPGALQVKLSKKITLLQAIAQAGGPTENAAKSRVLIKRRDPKTGKEIRIKVNMNDLIKGNKSDIQLLEGDVVFVPESFL
jgi:polysaccharide export outer membrane protein